MWSLVKRRIMRCAIMLYTCSSGRKACWIETSYEIGHKVRRLMPRHLLGHCFLTRQ